MCITLWDNSVYGQTLTGSMHTEFFSTLNFLPFPLWTQHKLKACLELVCGIEVGQSAFSVLPGLSVFNCQALLWI